MKIVTVIGARPQFIKANIVSQKLRLENEEVFIHTGQHYDSNMSENIFTELNIPKPNYNLGIGSGSHAFQTAIMLMKTEEILLKEKPDYVLVYGDTNTTLAGALAASKIHIPIIHIEAGLRSFNMKMPEEQNRIVTDHLSSVLFCPTSSAKKNLKNENIKNNVFVVGDVMCDAVMYYSRKALEKEIDYYLSKLNGLFGAIPKFESWYLATIHRAENTDKKEKMEEILDALENLDHKVIFPVHPRIKNVVSNFNSEKNYKNIIFTNPVGYLEMLYFTKMAVKVITDSGGLQKEAYILGTPCVTVREETEWRETLNGNYNILAQVDKEDILSKVLNTKINANKRKAYYGNGDATDKICDILKAF